jgi:PadR family transcriptional regulator PadR
LRPWVVAGPAPAAAESLHGEGRLFGQGIARRRVDKGKISSYTMTMRRKPDVLLPIEASILQAAVALAQAGTAEFHGYLIAGEVKEREGARLLTAYGTLYKALERLERQGLVASRWEDPAVAAGERRPLRRLYHVTAQGLHALAAITLSRGRAMVRPGMRAAEA